MLTTCVETERFITCNRRVAHKWDLHGELLYLHLLHTVTSGDSCIFVKKRLMQNLSLIWNNLEAT